MVWLELWGGVISNKFGLTCGASFLQRCHSVNAHVPLLFSYVRSRCAQVRCSRLGCVQIREWKLMNFLAAHLCYFNIGGVCWNSPKDSLEVNELLCCFCALAWVEKEKQSWVLARCLFPVVCNKRFAFIAFCVATNQSKQRKWFTEFSLWILCCGGHCVSSWWGGGSVSPNAVFWPPLHTHSGVGQDSCRFESENRPQLLKEWKRTNK